MGKGGVLGEEPPGMFDGIYGTEDISDRIKDNVRLEVLPRRTNDRRWVEIRQ